MDQLNTWNSMVKKVAIIDGQTIQTLPMAKSLKKQGYYVILFCENKNSYGYRTRFCDEKVIAPSTQKQEPDFHSFFLDYLKNNKVDILIPMNDYSAKYLSKNRGILKEHSSYIMPELDVFMTAYDKNQLMKICQTHNFPHPKTLDLAKDSFKKVPEYIGFPAIIKPNETTGARGFSIVNSIEEIENKLPAIQEKFGECHIQEFIPEGGKQFKVEIFMLNNELINASVIHKIRFYPEKGGSSCFNQTVNRPDLVELCFNVLKVIGWEGFADFDLIEDPRDGVEKIMEINPRVPACIKATFNAGVDFAENIVQASIQKMPTRFNYTPGSYLRYLGLDLLWFIKSKRRFKTKPGWFKAILSFNHYFQDGSFDDMKPFIFGTFGGFLKQLNPGFRAAKNEMA